MSGFQLKDKLQKHRHYDRVARREYLHFSKNRNPFKKQIKQIKKKQLQFLKRNLRQSEEVIVALEQKNKMEGAIGTIKNVFIRSRLKAKTDFGDLKELCKAVIGYNLTYAFATV